MYAREYPGGRYIVLSRCDGSIDSVWVLNGLGREGIKVTIETSFGIITASESTLNSLALELFMAAEAAITIRNELERNKFYNIKED